MIQTLSFAIIGLRYMIYLGLRDPAHGYLAQEFVDGYWRANCITISRIFFHQLIDSGLGGYNLIILGDEVKIEVDVATTMGIKASIQELLIL